MLWNFCLINCVNNKSVKITFVKSVLKCNKEWVKNIKLRKILDYLKPILLIISCLKIKLCVSLLRRKKFDIKTYLNNFSDYNWLNELRLELEFNSAVRVQIPKMSIKLLQTVCQGCICNLVFRHFYVLEYFWV